MSLPDDYFKILNCLAHAFSEYERQVGVSPILVGGAATAILTDGEFMSGDFDIIAARDEVFDAAMLSAGFVHEDRAGRLKRGWYHPEYLRYGVEQVGDSLFNGLADRERLLRLLVIDETITLPAIEDIIADRLGQHEVASASDQSRLNQALFLYRVSAGLDRDYLHRRIVDEGGDITNLDKNL